MQSASRYIIVSGLSAGCLSMVYFLSLVIHVPFLLTIPVAAALIYLLFKWALKNSWDEDSIPISAGLLPYIIWAICLYLFLKNSYEVSYKYGGWDAWCMWNLHAKYMAGGAPLWKNIFLNPNDHPDYPLLVPGFNGFLMRLFSAGATIIPFVFAFSITLMIPVLIFLETKKRSVIIAWLVFFLFARDKFYLQNGVSQYADTTLAFFFLMAIICLEYAKKDRQYMLFAALSLGCCIWTKNEGVILAAITVLFNLKLIFSAQNIKYFLGGLALPLITWGVLKLGFAPANDVLAGQGKQTLQQLTVGIRYQLIWKHFTQQLDNNFNYVQIAYLFYIVVCMLQKRLPDRRFVMITVCLIIYLMIYVVSPQDLEWHLITSLERLMHQLMPAMVYVLAQEFSGTNSLVTSRISWQRKF